MKRLTDVAHKTDFSSSSIEPRNLAAMYSVWWVREQRAGHLMDEQHVYGIVSAVVKVVQSKPTWHALRVEGDDGCSHGSCTSRPL